MEGMSAGVLFSLSKVKVWSKTENGQVFKHSRYHISIIHVETTCCTNVRPNLLIRLSKSSLFSYKFNW